MKRLFFHSFYFVVVAAFILALAKVGLASCGVTWTKTTQTTDTCSYISRSDNFNVRFSSSITAYITNTAYGECECGFWQNQICRPTFYNPNTLVYGGEPENQRVRWSQAAYDNKCEGVLYGECKDVPPARIVEREESCGTQGPVEEFQDF